jgi:hypothetical protein
MNTEMNKSNGSSISRLFFSFTPASRAVILFAVPFTLVDALHYYTAGTALIFSLPIVIIIYLYCGAQAAKFAHLDGQDLEALPRIGRSAGLRLWLTSTVINTLLAIILGFASFGFSLLGGAAYLCLFAPLHAIGSALVGWLGASYEVTASTVRFLSGREDQDGQEIPTNAQQVTISEGDDIPF